MAEHNPITKLTSGEETFDLGTTFNHVYLNEENDFSLEEFYNHMKTFLESDMFMIYSSKEPKEKNVKV